MTGRRLPYTATPDGLRLVIRLTPRAGRTGLDGLVEGADGRVHLQMRVAAPPVDGAANAALIRAISEGLGVRRSDIRIVSGETGRQKIVAIRGDRGILEARIGAWIADVPIRR